jgi:phosphoinositide-3-kinase regulatory subunit 4
MGNQITAIAPAQILPLESYFNDLVDYGKPNSLGSTRFFKVARSTHRDNVEMVVKVFAKHDPSLHLKPYETKLHVKPGHGAGLIREVSTLQRH